MFYWKYFSLVFVYFVLQIGTNQERTRYSTMPEYKIYPYSNNHLILITKTYSQLLAHHLKSFGFHQIVTLKRKRILILTIQRVFIQIRWKAWVSQYGNYGRKTITHQHWFCSNWRDALCYSKHSQRCKRSFRNWSYEIGQQYYQNIFLWSIWKVNACNSRHILDWVHWLW